MAAAIQMAVTGIWHGPRPFLVQNSQTEAPASCCRNLDKNWSLGKVVPPNSLNRRKEVAERSEAKLRAKRGVEWIRFLRPFFFRRRYL